MIMEMMEEIIGSRKDIQEYQEWEKRLNALHIPQ